jgi:polar amino acid transport system substrate-binding protein
MIKFKKYSQRVLILIVLQCTLMAKPFAATTQEVTILADDGYPPYSYSENGTAKGIYVDIVREAAKALAPHYKVNIVAYPWKRALSEMNRGTAFAILPPYQRIKERPYIWPYSVQILKEDVVAFCDKDINLLKKINAKTTEYTSPLIIGINAGYLILNNTLKRAKNDNKIVIAENKSTRANIMKLYVKRIDCYLNDKHSTYNELSNMQKETTINFDNIREALVVMIQTGHIGYSADPTKKFFFKEDFILRMDDALSRLKSSDTYQKIINDYTINK